MKIDYTALKKIGNEWHKNDMHRFYINLDEANAIYRDMPEDRMSGQLPMNRYERTNGKVWIDMETGEIETKNIRNDEDMIECIRELISFMGAEIKETEETVEAEEVAETEEYVEIEEATSEIWYAVMMDREDADWGTGSHNLEEAKEKVRKYRANGKPEAYIAVIDESGPDAFCVYEINDME